MADRSVIAEEQVSLGRKFLAFLARELWISCQPRPVLAVAESIPVKWLSKYKKQPVVIEALLLGQAGLLGKTQTVSEPVTKGISFPAEKYGLSPVYWPVQFLRMRPANFPTIRLAQLAALVHRSSHLFSVIRDTETVGMP